MQAPVHQLATAPSVKPQAAVTIVKGHGKLKPLMLTLGGDPELMLADMHQGGKIVSAIPVLGKDKHDPIDLGNGIKTYWDCVLLEASFPATSTEPGAIVERYRDVLTRIQEHIGDRYRLVPRASYVYPEDQLQDEGSCTIGCSVSYDAWHQSINQTTGFVGGLRTGSQHLHCWRADYQDAPDQRMLSTDSKEECAKIMDVFVGCSNTVFSKDPTATARRALYGKSSEFRSTAGGIEYRVLENWGLTNPKLTALIYDLAQYALSHISDGTATDILRSLDGKLVQRAINENDPVLARKVLTLAGLPSALMKRVEASYANPGLNKAWGI
jgi:hypothetical protein